MRHPSLWRPVSLLVGGLLGLCLCSPGDLLARELSFDDRVKAQEAIERVYYSHQIGVSKPFEESVSRELFETKVRTYLEQTVVLERFWKTEVTAEMLVREFERIARDSRFPERLLQIETALGGDRLLLLECFVRPVLVNRLSRNLFAHDAQIHAGPRDAATALRDLLLRGELTIEEAHPYRRVLEVVRGADRSAGSGADLDRPGTPPSAGPTVRIEVEDEEYERWIRRLPRMSGEVGAILENRDAFIIDVLDHAGVDSLWLVRYGIPKVAWEEWWRSVTTGIESLEITAAISPAEASILNLGDLRTPDSTCLPDDTWDNGSLDDFPRARAGHEGVWTGSLMLIWGNVHTDTGGNGARYDPLIDAWAPMSTVGAPAIANSHTAVWSGSEMLVWGGLTESSQFALEGGRYDPLTDTWQPVSTTDAPSGRYTHSAIWTGQKMIVWGGGRPATPGVPMNDGGIYDPALDTWRSMTTLNAPTPRQGHTAVWTGQEMIVWGGANTATYPWTYPTDGGRYDPSSDTWTQTATSGAPESRWVHSAVWTGSEMIVWGGLRQYANLATGGRYDPVADSWVLTSTVAAPSERNAHTAIWTGSEMIIWGGLYSIIDFEQALDTGGRYDPLSDTWAPSTTVGSPTARANHSTVWSGSEMIVWGGHGHVSQGNRTNYQTGSRYDPAADSWTPTSLGDAAAGGYGHTSVWTGNHVIIFGGSSIGARYDPAIDAWTPISTTYAPLSSIGAGHSAIWTGAEMIVWGGPAYVDTGGRYDPLSDAWLPVSTVNAPVGRRDHTAVWTGAEMIVWGGYGPGVIELGTGGRYRPSTDNWSPTSMADAPQARDSHTAVWTGSEMIIWGGLGDSFPPLNSGGRYDPSTDTWTATDTLTAPQERYGHVAVWTGDRLIVWGGRGDGNQSLQTGGRYDPPADSWMPTSLTDAPSQYGSYAAVWSTREMLLWDAYIGGGRYDPVLDDWDPMSIIGAPLLGGSPTAVWTGSFMIVYGTRLGGRYALGQARDDDGDGFRVCDGDCDDGNPATFPGAPQICDGDHNDCDDPTWPIVPPDEFDGDLDGFGLCGGECDDSADTVFPGAPEICDGLNNDCDDPAWPALPTDEFDDDGDGTRECEGDCDDGLNTVFPGAPQLCDGLNNDCNDPDWPIVSPDEFDGDMDGFALCNGECQDMDVCTFPGAPQVCDGVNNDCGDAAWPAVTPDEIDDDGDGFVECGPFAALCPGGGPPTILGGRDCDDADATTYPDAPEINDGDDNQCPGDLGFGVADETSGNSGFHNPADPSEYSWTPQAGANRYEVLRSDVPDFSAGCVETKTSQSSWVDASTPSRGNSFFYLNRPFKPKTGSWGQDSAGAERLNVCP
jgi:N-acetylneuraminic acid mutarotase